MRVKYGLVLVAAALSLAACGGEDPGGDGVASLNGSTGQSSQAPAPAADDELTKDEQLAFARCMRDNGVDMPDPVDGRITIEAGGPGDAAKMEKANEACRHLLPNGGVPKPPTPEELDQMRKTAQCFRDHGINVPDPDPQNPGMTMPEEVGPDDPRMKKALEECAADGMPVMRAVPGK
ncbi:hypothetical protein [Amycolatopsis albispora]|uniref:Secreted protein n=1 Tax=Amycolatopsis albispora TaxID=1804986 RepID=A0A344LBP6_9PSEU|nr:hypothetical protein [Amycolatopsis albispora]AXB45470.1 hypothetical protein A4R43_25715 [Amycolatopsis albispora]